MGAIRPVKLRNGNEGLEITYGGKESPFGGVDTSAPPAYIDPKCFVASDGHLVIDNKLVAASLVPLLIPGNLWDNVAHVILLAFGTYYQTSYGQLNYALGYIVNSFGTPSVSPTGKDYTFYMSTWNPTNPTAAISNETLDVRFYDCTIPPTNASITLPLIPTNSQFDTSNSSATVNILAVHSQDGQDGWLLSAADLTVTGGVGYSAGEYLGIIQGSATLAVIKVVTTGGGGSIATWMFEDAAPGYTVGPASSLPLIGAQVQIRILGSADITYGVNLPPSGTISQILAATAGVINAGPDPDVQASVSSDGLSLVLTAIATGAAGNSIQVQDQSTNGDAALPPPYYYPASALTNLTGGADAVSVTAPGFFVNASVVEVGGTLYIGNLGPLILKYTEPGNFQISSAYQGVGVLKKFAGSLIGLRIRPQLGTVVQNADFVWAWSAANALDEWSPLTTQGFVTGAGFEQIADIGDYLAGLIVANGTAFILRAKGISYATATGNAALPFSVNHIGLGDQGEGCPLPALVCQYDQTGVFVGNTNVFQASGTITKIGDKIKAALFQALTSITSLGSYNLVSAAACPVFIGSDEFALITLGMASYDGTVINALSFLYNAENGTWMPITYQSGVGIGLIHTILTSPIASLDVGADSDIYNQTLMGYAFQHEFSGIADAPSFFVLQEGVPNVNSISNQAGVAFPQEEVLFGRDVTVDSLYVSLWAKVSENTFVDFYFNDTLYATLELDPASFASLNGSPIERQVFAVNYGAGAKTQHSPQLKYKIRSLTDTGTAYIRFAKIMFLASFDSSQRPT